MLRIAVGTSVTPLPPGEGRSPAPGSHRTKGAFLPHYAGQKLIPSVAIALQLRIRALVKKVVFDEVQCFPTEFNNAEQHVCKTGKNFAWTWPEGCGIVRECG
jgi:hypothetical protein